MGKNKREIEVEVEENGRKIEVEIEEEGETADATVESEVKETAETPRAGRKRSGPGFLLGLVIGAIAGAVAAIAFSPGEEEGGVPAAYRSGTTPQDEDRAQSLLGQVRARLSEARNEARVAAREAEQRSRARYAELTGNED
jgi:hypothetical protein